MNLIQAFPAGLQSLLDIKGGDLPKSLREEITPTLDVTQLYLLGKRESVVFAGVAAAAGFNTFTDSLVPVGQAWYVWSFSITANIGAGAQFTGRPAANLGGNGHAVGGQIIVPASQQDRIMAQAPMLLAPGDSLGFVCQTQTLAPSIVGVVNITRLKV